MSDLGDTQAFPVSLGIEGAETGMTIHQYFAGQALQGILANKRTHPGEYLATHAKDSLRAADAMILAYEGYEERAGHNF